MNNLDESGDNKYQPTKLTSLRFEIQGEVEPELQQMLDMTLGQLQRRLGGDTEELVGGVTVKIGQGLVEGGGQAIAEENLVLLDYDKMKMTLQDSEDFLVQAGIFEPGQRTSVLLDIKDEPWSTVAYELTHELGHIIGERAGVVLDTALSPTKYGKNAPHEALAEAFTYWVFDVGQDQGAVQAIGNITGVNR